HDRGHTGVETARRRVRGAGGRAAAGRRGGGDGYHARGRGDELGLSHGAEKPLSVRVTVPAVGRVDGGGGARLVARGRAQRDPFGSKASRSPSPSRLNARTVMKIAVPGTIRYSGSIWKVPIAELIIAPQDGVGSFTPTPRKESPASNRMFAGISRVAYTRIGASRLGSSSRTMIRPGRAPSERAAATNSRSRSAMVWPRTIRPMYGQEKKPMTTTSTPNRSPLPVSPNALSGSTPMMAMAKSSSGKARKTSMTRLMTASIQPPKYPAVTPSSTPIAMATRVETPAMPSETRAP